MQFEDVFTFENLLKAHYKSRKSKRHKKEVILFEDNLLVNIENLRRRLLNRTYCIVSYNQFTIYEPKRREVAALAYEDRVVQHCFCDNYLTPLLSDRLIFDNAACRKEKGTDFARDRVVRFLRSFYGRNGLNGYVLRFDIHHYFEEIDHEILKGKINRAVKDKAIGSFCSMIIDSFHKDVGKGLPLGNQTSQAFALYYLDAVDRLIKEKYRIRYYSRYTDDGVVVYDDLDKLKLLLLDIKNELEGLRLSLNNKTVIAPIRNQFAYLGVNFRLLANGKVLQTVNHMKKARIKRYLKSVKHNKDAIQSLTSYLSKFNECCFIRKHLIKASELTGDLRPY